MHNNNLKKHSMIILNPKLAPDFFNITFSNDIKEMYASPDSISQTSKEKSKEIALSLSEEFKTKIIDFYFDNGAAEITDDNFDILFDNFDRFTQKLIKKLISIQSEIIVYQSVSIMWTGIFTQLERESKIANDVGMIRASQYFCMELIKAQTTFYKSLKN